MKKKPKKDKKVSKFKQGNSGTFHRHKKDPLEKILDDIDFQRARARSQQGWLSS